MTEDVARSAFAFHYVKQEYEISERNEACTVTTLVTCVRLHSLTATVSGRSYVEGPKYLRHRQPQVSLCQMNTRTETASGTVTPMIAELRIRCGSQLWSEGCNAFEIIGVESLGVWEAFFVSLHTESVDEDLTAFGNQVAVDPVVCKGISQEFHDTFSLSLCLQLSFSSHACRSASDK